MRLVHEAGNNDMKPWAVFILFLFLIQVFDNDKNVKYTDFKKVKAMIEQLTDKDAGRNKGSNKFINRYYS